MKKTHALAAGVLLTAVGAAAAGVTAQGAFASLKGLAGTWTGTTRSGAPIEVVFRVASNGTAVLETQSPAEADEMVTVYSIDGDDVVLTHYCPMGPHGNQPRMRLDRKASTPRELRFLFSGATNIDPAADLHVHDGRLILDGPDRLVREWDIFNHGRLAGTERFELTRKTGGAER
jgi:hypothetical protein